MAERQAHGKKYEQVIAERYRSQNIEVYTDTKCYTNEWDGMFKGLPISIKNPTFGASIEMADLFRNANKKSNFYLFVGFHAPDDKYKLVEEHVLLIPYEWYTSLFVKDLLPYFKRLIINISNSYEDDGRWKAGCKLLRQYWDKYSLDIINPYFKRDHKSQKRMQCAIPNTKFYKYFIPYEVNINGA